MFGPQQLLPAFRKSNVTPKFACHFAHDSLTRLCRSLLQLTDDDVAKLVPNLDVRRLLIDYIQKQKLSGHTLCLLVRFHFVSVDAKATAPSACSPSKPVSGEGKDDAKTAASDAKAAPQSDTESLKTAGKHAAEAAPADEPAAKRQKKEKPEIKLPEGFKVRHSVVCC